ncbi:MAG: hypothetical protein WC071_10350 [Victivallaceae bacterium]
MSGKWKLLLLSSMVALAATAEDITTADGTVYKDVKISETTPLGINAVCGEQAVWIDYRDLAPEVAARYGYDPAKSAEFEKALDRQQNTTQTTSAPATTVPAAVPVVQQPTTTVPAAAPVVQQPTTVPAPNPAVVKPATRVVVQAQPPQFTGIAVSTPIVSITAGVSAPPPAQSSVIVINDNDPVVYDATIVQEPVTTVWVLWNGRYYPRYWWHYGYWNNRYIKYNGRYYPAHYFKQTGVWYHNKYYRYAPDRRNHFPESGRTVYDRNSGSRQQPAHQDNRGYDNNSGKYDKSYNQNTRNNNNNQYDKSYNRDTRDNDDRKRDRH